MFNLVRNKKIADSLYIHNKYILIRIVFLYAGQLLCILCQEHLPIVLIGHPLYTFTKDASLVSFLCQLCLKINILFF